MSKQPVEVIKRYLQDAIAAEKSFESQLRDFAEEGRLEDLRELFTRHADETRSQYERLTDRLHALGGSPSGVKSIMAHLFGSTPKVAQLGHDEAEQMTQNLMMAYTVEHSEIAMYESLATAASAAGDNVTERLAREIQSEERRTAELLWEALPRAARFAFDEVTGRRTMTP
jgi:ferritin-like metal-binding protein YciE